VAILIVDNPNSISGRFAFTALSDIGPVTAVCEEKSFRKMLRTEIDPMVPIAIDVSASLGNAKYLPADFHGLEIAEMLRCYCLLRNPIILISLFPSDFFSASPMRAGFEMIGSPGTSILSPPFSTKRLAELIRGAGPLSNDELDHVIHEFCDLHGAWGRTIHQLESHFRDLLKYRKDIVWLLSVMAGSVLRFAPRASPKLDDLKRLIDSKPQTTRPGKVRYALDELSAALKGVEIVAPELVDLPALPPAGYQKILIADDMPQDFLLSELAGTFGYDVIEPQAYRLSDAKRMLEQHLPDVILADMYFKRSTRGTEVGDKAVGDEFIKFALNHPAYAGSGPKLPLVLVTSKAILDPATEIRFGAIDCSGSRRASDPFAIHETIWREARRRGSTTFAITNRNLPESGFDWDRECAKLQNDCSRILGAIRGFQRACIATQLGFKALESRVGATILSSFTHLQDSLSTYSTISESSQGLFIELFSRLNDAQQSARLIENSSHRSDISDLLHGGLAQYTFLLPDIRELLERTRRCAQQLVATKKRKHAKAGKEIMDLLDEYEPNRPLVTFLEAVSESVQRAVRRRVDSIESLGELANNKDKRASEFVKVVVVEDNSHWAEFVCNAVRALGRSLGSKYALQTVMCRTLADVAPHIEKEKARRQNGPSGGKKERTIFIVDLCIPTGAGSQNQAERKLDEICLDDPPRFEHGKELVRWLTSYQVGAPVIIWSTSDYLNLLKAEPKVGVPSDRRIAKQDDAGKKLGVELAKIIERADKPIITRHLDRFGDPSFAISSTALSFSPKLERTFELIYEHCQLNATREFSLVDLVGFSSPPDGLPSRSRAYEHLYRIRQIIHEAFATQGKYIDPRTIIETRRTRAGAVFRLNAEVMSIDDEESLLEQTEVEHSNLRIGVVGDSSTVRPDLAEVLASFGIEIIDFESDSAKEQGVVLDPVDIIWRFDGQCPKGETRKEQVDRKLVSVSIPHVSLLYGVEENDRRMRETESDTVDLAQNGWLSKALHASRYLVSKAPGVTARSTTDVAPPLIEIRPGHDLKQGLFEAVVNDVEFRINRSPLSRILGVLLSQPNTLVDWEVIGTVAKGRQYVSDNDKKNWLKRLRIIAANRWLGDSHPTPRAAASAILQSSNKGVTLIALVRFSR
jgi:CheY-like chemotaxis protein